MAPIRVGLIGLGCVNEHTMLGGWGVNAHLRSIQALPNEYKVVAVANSTVESAQKSIEFHKLPAGTKAYGNPDDIAADPNVDLVVVSVNVARHYELTKPAIEHKKAVFVEWPLSVTTAQAERLASLAASKGVRTMVGLQGRADPLTVKLKELVNSGRIGNVESSTVTFCTSALPIEKFPQGGEFFLDWKSGGNMYTIMLGHFLDSFTYVLGDFAEVQGHFKVQISSVPLIDPSTGETIDPAYPKTAPDHYLVSGTLENGAVASIAVRKAKAAVDKRSILWYITGTEGEILVETEEGVYQCGVASMRSLKVIRGGKEDEAEVIDFVTNDNSAAVKVPYPGTNTARQYEGFAQKSPEIATFQSALNNHRLLQRIAKSAGWE